MGGGASSNKVGKDSSIDLGQNIVHGNSNGMKNNGNQQKNKKLVPKSLIPSPFKKHLKPKTLMKAAILNEPKAPFLIKNIEILPLREREVLVKMKAAGICQRDWEVANGSKSCTFPVLCGHEGSGMVEAVGEGVIDFRPGDMVTLSCVSSCHRCFYCVRGRPRLCHSNVEADPTSPETYQVTPIRYRTEEELPVSQFLGIGCFAEKVVVPAANCVLMPEHLPPMIAALMGCAIPTGIGSVLNTAKVEAGSSVAVFGCGVLGMATIIGAKLAGASCIIAVEKTQASAERANEFGATQALVWREEDRHQTLKSIRDATEGRGADYAFETIGSPTMQELALEAIRPGGMLVLTGTAATETVTSLPTGLLARQQKTVVGSCDGFCIPSKDFPFYAELCTKKQIDLLKLVTKTYTLEDLNEAFNDLMEGRLTHGIVMLNVPTNT